MDNRPDTQIDSFDHRYYVPCLRWKQGEYQAVLRLKPQTRSKILPLIEVPEIGWDFEERRDRKTLDDHLKPFAKRVELKWGRSSCFVDMNLLDSQARMQDGSHPVDYVLDELRKRGCAAIPVTGLDRETDYQRAIRRAVRKDRRGVCLRLSLTDAARGTVQKTVDGLLQELRADPKDTDFILDLDAPANFIPIEGFANLLLALTRRLPYREEWRQFILIGTSFPKTMGDLTVGPQLIPRHEWSTYRKLHTMLSDANLRIPKFGDYGVCHPEVRQIDMRVVKPAASIRYTVDNAWYVLKGRNVRENNGYRQYRTLCEELVASSHFLGRDLSQGDAYIEDCANGVESTGNLTTWRWVGTNHHIEKLALDIANWLAS